MITEAALRADAPPKPAVGAPCNGCGLCCAAETCPVGMLRFLRRTGPCPALEWSGDRYRCAFVAGTRRLLPLPRAWTVRAAARWIAAGSGCDCRAEIV